MHKYESNDKIHRMFYIRRINIRVLVFSENLLSRKCPKPVVNLWVLVYIRYKRAHSWEPFSGELHIQESSSRYICMGERLLTTFAVSETFLTRPWHTYRSATEFSLGGYANLISIPVFIGPIAISANRTSSYTPWSRYSFPRQFIAAYPPATRDSRIDLEESR